MGNEVLFLVNVYFILKSVLIQLPPVLMIKIKRMGKFLVETPRGRIILLLCIPHINPLCVCAVEVERTSNAHPEICLAREF